jgi:hypothetical protein
VSLSEQARERLEELVALQPTKNAELIDRWGLEDGSAVHQYLESELKEYYYRDENSLIRASEAAYDLLGVEPEDENADERTVRVPDLQAAILAVLPGPEAESDSVVSVLQAVREASDFDLDPEPDDVRSALRSLADKGLVEVIRRTVPTYRLALDRGKLTVERLDGD